MRNWHRRLSIYVGALMLLIAISGIALQIEMMLVDRSSLPGEDDGKPIAAAVAEAEIEKLVASTLAGARRQTKGAIIGLDFRFFGPRPSVEVVVAEPEMRKLKLDARTGELFDAEAREDGFDWHRFLLDLHRGAIIGTTGLWISILCGVVLAILSVTGVVMYIQMYLRRRQSKPGFHW
ncbi:PepSY domain-containing protein [Oxalobacteraceae bacterium OTU3CAMAD1]|nr:PepSY domain-containing protein [Oxalobacteraceae bacterium OTU3CAMAD1]